MIIDEIKKLNIAVIIPTYKRIDQVNKLVRSIHKNCILPLKILVIDDDPFPGGDIINTDTKNIFLNSDSCVEEIKNSEKHGITAARNFAINCAFNTFQGKVNHIVYFDDDSICGKGAIERMVALQYQENKFVVSATVGNYIRFWRDFKKDDVRFYTSLGISYSFLPEFIKKFGMQDEDLVIRADHEYTLRAWKNGYWTACVYAPVVHKRFAERDDGSKLSDNKSKYWEQDAIKISEKYPDLVKRSKNNCIRIRFKYPDIKYKLYEDLSLKRIFKRRRRIWNQQSAL